MAQPTKEQPTVKPGEQAPPPPSDPALARAQVLAQVQSKTGARLVAARPFSAWDHHYNPGDPVDWNDWPEEHRAMAIQNRLNEDFVQFVT